MTVSAHDQRFAYLRMDGFKTTSSCRFVDEHFRGISLDTTHSWRVTYLNAGSGAFVDDLACGVYRMLTDSNINDSGILDRNNIRIVDPSLLPWIGFRAKLPDIADVNIEMRLGLVDVFNTDHCVFEVDRSAHGNFSIYTDSYNATVQKENTDTGIDVDANWHDYELYLDAAGKSYWWIDGTLKVTGSDADVDPAEFFQPYAEILTENGDVKTLELDFIKGIQKSD